MIFSNFFFFINSQQQKGFLCNKNNSLMFDKNAVFITKSTNNTQLRMAIWFEVDVLTIFLNNFLIVWHSSQGLPFWWKSSSIIMDASFVAVNRGWKGDFSNWCATKLRGFQGGSIRLPFRKVALIDRWFSYFLI